MRTLMDEFTIKKTTYVDKTGKRQVKFKVVPETVVLMPGQKVKIILDGPQTGVVMLPMAGVFAQQVNRIPKAKEPQLTLKVLPKAPRGEFPFAVICKDDGVDHYGEGKSPPKMLIIDPKR